jgi:hypothetical protein
MFINGWKWSTHQILAETIAESMNLDLNATVVKEGSIAPDKYFKDFRHHSYPNSVNKSYFWLNKTIYYYSIKDINNASYSFGILTHYVSDTFAAPHAVTKEDYNLHAQYEEQVSYYKPRTRCLRYNFNLAEELKKSQYNKNHWPEWLKTKDQKIPQAEVEQSLKLLFPLASYIFNKECKKEKIFLPFNSLEISLKKIIALYVILALIIVTTYSILRNNK